MLNRSYPVDVSGKRIEIERQSSGGLARSNVQDSVGRALTNVISAIARDLEEDRGRETQNGAGDHGDHDGCAAAPLCQGGHLRSRREKMTVARSRSTAM